MPFEPLKLEMVLRSMEENVSLQPIYRSYDAVNSGRVF